MKLLRHIINILVWTVVAVYLLTLTLLRLPAIQSAIGAALAEALGERIGSRVSIERVDIGLMGRLVVDGVVIDDPEGSEMLSASRLAVKLNLIDLCQGRINIGSAQMFSTHIVLRQDSLGAPLNIQPLIDALTSSDTTRHAKPLDLTIGSLIMRRGSLQYDRLDSPKATKGFDPGHVRLDDISLYVLLHSIRDDTLDIGIRKIAFREQSGLELKSLSMELRTGPSGACLDNLNLGLRGSSLSIPHIEATYKTDMRKDSLTGKKSFRLKPETLCFSGSIDCPKLTLADAAPLAKGLTDFRGSIDISSTLSGGYGYLVIDSLHVSSTEGDIDIDLSGSITDIRGEAPWQLSINRFDASAKSVGFIMQNLEGRQLSPPAIVGRMGDIAFTGEAEGKGNKEVALRGFIATEVGNLSLSARMGEGRAFEAKLQTDGLDMARLTDNADLGSMATDLSLSGRLPHEGEPVVDAKGIIEHFSYKGYEYSNIELDGSYDGKEVSGLVSIDDPNLKLRVAGRASLPSRGSSSEEPAQQRGNSQGLRGASLLFQLADLSPEATGLSSRWGAARFCATIEAAFEGSSLNDMDGRISIKGLTMTSEEDTCLIDNIELTAGTSAGTHSLLLEADFGMASLSGQFSFETLGQTFVNIVASRLPTLPGLPENRQPSGNDFSFSARLDKTSWMKPLLGVPLEAAEPITMWGRISDEDDYLLLSLAVPEATFDGSRYNDATLYMASFTDSISCDITLYRQDPKGQETEIKMGLGAANNRLTMRAGWDNNNLKARLNAHATMFNDAQGRQLAVMTIDPSIIELGGQRWNIKSEGITYRNKDLEVEGIDISHEDQYLRLRGRASESPDDTLRVGFGGLNVAYILDLVNFHSVEFSGQATGLASIVSPFAGLDAKARLTVDDFKFQDGRMGTLDASVDYDNEQGQINIHAVADDGPEAKTYIYGLVAPGRKLIDIDFIAEGTYLDFIQSFTTNFFSDIKGQTWGALKLHGAPGSLDLTGKMVADFETTVTPVGCRYKVERDTVFFVPNEIEFRGLTIADRHGNRGTVNGQLHHQHLRRMTYDLGIEARRMLCYDFKDFGDNSFYGTVYATGSIDLHGVSGALTMDIDVSPERGSTIVYDVGSADASADYQEFITWRDAAEAMTRSRGSSPEEPAPRTSTEERLADMTDMHLNFIVDCNPNATIKLLMDRQAGDYITLHGDGVLRAAYYNKGPFTMYGTYRVSDGTYDLTIQNLLKKKFSFNEGGTLAFGGNPFDAQLNLQASYTVSGVSLSDLNIGNTYSGNTIRVNCLMNIGGVARSPQVSFDLDMPTVSSDEKQMVKSLINSEEQMNQQVVYLLGIGRFYPQGSNNSRTQSGSEQSETALAMQSLLSGTLSSQINSLLGSFIKSDNWTFGANIATGNDGWNNAEYEGIVSGKLLNNRLLINGQFGYRDNVATNSQSFIGDFDIRYLLFPNGNLALRVYNQSNDRYFTKSSLNTQGIGIIMKKDFTNLRDLTGGRK